MNLPASLRVLLLLIVASRSASAVVPLTPSFDPQTQARGLQQLQQAHVPSVGQNSVFIAIQSALGFEPQTTVFKYDEPYPHLPTVSVNSRIQKPGCAFITAVVQGNADAGYSKVLVSGSFCLVGPARWSSLDLVAIMASDR